MYNNIKDISHYLNKYYLNNTSLYPPYQFYELFSFSNTKCYAHGNLCLLFQMCNVYNLYQL